MGIIVVRQKMNRAEAEDLIQRTEQFLKDHPRRRVVRTDWIKIRKGHIKEDVQKICYEELP
jgi:hypothetical protein